MTDTPKQEPKAPAESAASSAAKKSNKTAFIAIAVIVLIVAIAGYVSSTRKSDNEKAVENLLQTAAGSKVDVSTKDDNLKITSKEGDETVTVGTNQKLPDDFPVNDVPYLKAKSIEFALSGTSNNKKTWSVITKVDESVDDAAKYIQSKMTELGYEQKTSAGTAAEYRLIAGDNAAYDVVVTISRPAGSNQTSLSYSVKQN